MDRAGWYGGRPPEPPPRRGARAPAKVNLTLHVLGRRADGYHDLASLVAFAALGDRVSLAPGEGLSLTVEGPTAGGLLTGPDNLVLRATARLALGVLGLRRGAFALEKNIPVAAGLGGGSSDAAAALRLLARTNGLRLDHPVLAAAAEATGADVPVCLAPRARMMAGTGDEVGPPLRPPALPAVLVNPGVPLATAAVFARLGLRPGESLEGADHPEIAETPSREALLDALARGRNDLEPPALAVAPEIGQALDALRKQEGCALARMSGSGATVFGLFGTREEARAACEALTAEQPNWWARVTTLR